MREQDWVSDDIDTERPSPARIYDYWLGGAHNFAADRQVAEQMIATYPDVRRKIWANRAFLRRAMEFLVRAGVRQFLDVGSGVPTVGHVHEVAQNAAPESRVVLVDVDPVAVEHSRLILDGNDRTAVIHEDVRRPERILEAPDLRHLFDLREPVAVLAVALFHFIPDEDDPAGIVSHLTAPLAPAVTLRCRTPPPTGRMIGPRAKISTDPHASTARCGAARRLKPYS
jgi:S-adenosyl methyltransferase